MGTRKDPMVPNRWGINCIGDEGMVHAEFQYMHKGQQFHEDLCHPLYARDEPDKVIAHGVGGKSWEDRLIHLLGVWLRYRGTGFFFVGSEKYKVVRVDEVCQCE
jgi:hypothetical protein